MQLSESVPHEDKTAKILREMKEDRATGPDMLPTKIIRECADVLAKPFKIMALR